MKLTPYIQQGLRMLGLKLPRKVLRKLGSVVGNLELGVWLKDHDFVLDRWVTRREELFELVAAEVGHLPVLYLEFGVARGEATRTWSRLLKHPDAVLHGFDSFKGFPEDWVAAPKGAWSTGGVPPALGDPRVRFFTGLFDQTLPTYQAPQRDVVVFMMDAALFRSTIYVLRRLRSLFRAGTYLYFDEFAAYGHEERAFRDFVEETGITFRLRGGTRGLEHVLFQCVKS